MVLKKTSHQLDLMRQSGQISAKALEKVLEAVKVGVNLLTLEKIAEDEILNWGGQPSFKTVNGYKWASCLSVNQEVVHGLPRDYRLKKGDLLSVDLGTVFTGWHTDVAWSVVVGKRSQGIKGKFLKIGEEALWAGVKQAVAGKTIGDISHAIQTKVEGANYSVVRSLVGHGIGRNLHEEPEVPGVGQAGIGLILEVGMPLAIEAIYTNGGSEVVLGRDGWTISTRDGSLGGLFEMTVVVGKDQAEVLTDWRSVS